MTNKSIKANETVFITEASPGEGVFDIRLVFPNQTLSQHAESLKSQIDASVIDKHKVQVQLKTSSEASNQTSDKAIESFVTLCQKWFLFIEKLCNDKTLGPRAVNGSATPGMALSIRCHVSQSSLVVGIISYFTEIASENVAPKILSTILFKGLIDTAGVIHGEITSDTPIHGPFSSISDFLVMSDKYTINVQSLNAV